MWIKSQKTFNSIIITDYTEYTHIGKDPHVYYIYSNTDLKHYQTQYDSEEPNKATNKYNNIRKISSFLFCWDWDEKIHTSVKLWS